MKLSEIPDDVVTSQTIGKVVRKLFPNVGVKTGKSKLTKGKTVHVYSGITWNDASSPDNKTQRLQHLAVNLPDCCFHLTKPTDEKISFAVKSGYVANGNDVLKVVTITKHTSHCTWSLAIRGKEIPLKEHEISSVFEPSMESLENVVHLVSKLQVCLGVPALHINDEHRSVFKDFVESTNGTDTCTTEYVRSMKCQGVAGLLHMEGSIR